MPVRPTLASPARRLAGFLIDYVVITAAAVIAIAIFGAHSAGVTVSVVVVNTVYNVGGTAIWGRTLGKLVVHTEVVRRDGVAPPGFRVALDPLSRRGAGTAVALLRWVRWLARRVLDRRGVRADLGARAARAARPGRRDRRDQIPLTGGGQGSSRTLPQRSMTRPSYAASTPAPAAMRRPHRRCASARGG